MNDPQLRTSTENEFIEVPISLADIIRSVWRGRRLILSVAVAVAVLTAGVTLLIPNSYRSTVTILPETEQNNLGASLSGLSSLASLAGVSVGQVSLSELYPSIVESEAVLRPVIEQKFLVDSSGRRQSLAEFWEIEEETPERTYEECLEQLRDELDIVQDRTTFILTASIETTEPVFSANVVNAVSAQLDEFLRRMRITHASEQRSWIEGRLEEVLLELQTSEGKLKDFREKNRRVNDSPQLLLEQERLGREVAINTALYTELKKQLELVKIEEIKNVPVVTLMDAGRPAAQKSKPRRSIIVLAMAFLAGLCAVMACLVLPHYRETLKPAMERWRGRSRFFQFVAGLVGDVLGGDGPMSSQRPSSKDHV